MTPGHECTLDKRLRVAGLRGWSAGSDSPLAWILNFEDVACRLVARVSCLAPDSASVINNFEKADKVLNTLARTLAVCLGTRHYPG